MTDMSVACEEARMSLGGALEGLLERTGVYRSAPHARGCCVHAQLPSSCPPVALQLQLAWPTASKLSPAAPPYFLPVLFFID